MLVLFRSWSLSRGGLIWAVAGFVALTANQRFFAEVTAFYPLSGFAGFVTSVAVLLVCAIAALSAVLSLLLPVRLVLTVLLVTSALVGHFSDALGIVIDDAMIRNIVRTDAGEATDLLSSDLALRVLVSGVIPAVVVWLLPIRRTSVVRRQVGLVAVLGVALLGMAGMIVPQTDAYASFFRTHKSLRYYTNPTYPLYSLIEYVLADDSVGGAHAFETRVSAVTRSDGDSARELVIVIVGETARADHFGINGYARQTTPKLAERTRLVSFREMRSCGTSTAISVPCLFSFDPRSTFDPDRADHTENVLDVLARAGVSVLWRDNNSGSQGVADRLDYESFRSPDRNPVCDSVECRDIGMLDGLDDHIASQTGDILIVLHQMGSHGPAYFKRYPDQFRQFVPDCQSSNLEDCELETIINAYDNTILYTDDLIDRAIGFLEPYQSDYETSLLYVGDHGESLGEMGIYLHGLPYSFAPDAQTGVPFIVWVGERSDIDLEALQAVKDIPTSHDAFSDALLSLFEVRVDGADAAVESDLLPLRE